MKTNDVEWASTDEGGGIQRCYSVQTHLRSTVKSSVTDNQRETVFQEKTKCRERFELENMSPLFIFLGITQGSLRNITVARNIANAQ